MFLISTENAKLSLRSNKRQRDTSTNLKLPERIGREQRKPNLKRKTEELRSLPISKDCENRLNKLLNWKWRRLRTESGPR